MWTLSRPVMLLIAAVGVGGYFLGGATARDNTLFGSTVAAWAQAIFAAAAVFAAAWLQERFIIRQAEASKRHVYESAASTARWVLQSFENLQKSIDGKNVKGRDFVALEGQGPLTLSMKVLSELKLSDFDDPVLATAVFNLQGTMIEVSRRREAQFATATVAPEPIVTVGWAAQDCAAAWKKGSDAYVERPDRQGGFGGLIRSGRSRSGCWSWRHGWAKSGVRASRMLLGAYNSSWIGGRVKMRWTLLALTGLQFNAQ